MPVTAIALPTGILVAFASGFVLRKRSNAEQMPTYIIASESAVKDTTDRKLPVTASNQTTVPNSRIDAYGVPKR